MLRVTWLIAVLLAVILSVKGASWPPLPTEEKPLAQRLWALAQAHMTGKVSDDIIERRNKDDLENGMIRLTDDNYKSLVEDSSEDILWVLMVHEERVSHASMPFFDAHAKAARLFNTTRISPSSPSPPSEAGTQTEGISSSPSIDLREGREKHGKIVKFARMDFKTEWKMCTRYLVFRPPRLILISDHGKTLRFLLPSEIQPIGEKWAEWIKAGEWTTIQVWDGSFAPGGDLQWLIEKYIGAFESFSKVNTLPPFVWMLLSGVLGKYILEYMWSSGPVARGPRAKPAVGVSGARTQSGQAAAKSKKTQ